MGSSVLMHPNADNINVAGAGNVGLTFRSPTNAQGAIYFADGTSGDDRQRGMIVYNHSDNSIRLHTNTEERLKIDSSGRVGIGTSSPIRELDVVNTNGDADLRIESTGTGGDGRLELIADNTGVSQIRLGDQDSNNPGAITYTHSDNTLTFKVNNTERIRIDSSGTATFSGSLNVGTVSVYADNSAAIAGGLSAGDVYRKSDGTLMITY